MYCLNIKIIYEDDQLVVINKPSGVVCNRAESVKGETLQDWMEARVGRPTGSPVQDDEHLFAEFVSKSGLVHRLDKETSGAMVLVKTFEAYKGLKSQFMERKTKKKYLALIHGLVRPNSGTINLPIKRNILNRHKFCVNVDGKISRTEYQVLSIMYKGESVFSLVELNLLTGRTHQIRVHMSHLGYPLVSDPLYLGKRLKSDLQWCPRLFLHAKWLSFVHPTTGKRVEFDSELHEDLSGALKWLMASG